MCSARQSATSRRRSRGFTLVELMVGIALGLLASLAVTQVLVGSQGQKRTTTALSDAQINGAMALDTLQRSLLPAGYGFAGVPHVVGCTLTAVYNGAPIADTLPDFPSVLAPVTITDGAGGAPDTIRVFASGKTSFSVPLRIVPPAYNPSDPSANQRFSVTAVRGVEGPRTGDSGSQVYAGDLMVAAVDTSQPCELFRVTGISSTSTFVLREDHEGGWNAVGHPSGFYAGGSLLNLGQPIDVTYSVDGSSLRVRTLRVDAAGQPSYDGPHELYSGVVNLQAMYGKDTSSPPDGTVDAWDNNTPTDNAGWRQVIAVRVALVVRSSQYEREEVTAENPLWDVGSAIAISGTEDCGSSKCLRLKVDHLSDWKHYRYRVFDTIVPLRNMLWSES